MAELIKARVHLIVAVKGDDPFSFRTDVLALCRDPEWIYGEALGCVVRALLAVKMPAHHLRVLNHSIEWVPSLREMDRG